MLVCLYLHAENGVNTLQPFYKRITLHTMARCDFIEPRSEPVYSDRAVVSMQASIPALILKFQRTSLEVTRTRCTFCA